MSRFSGSAMQPLTAGPLCAPVGVSLGPQDAQQPLCQAGPSSAHTSYVLAPSPLKEMQQRQQQGQGFTAGSPLWSPGGSRVSHSDRFVPTRSAAARLDFSALDREMVTAEVSKSIADREDASPAYNLLLRSELLQAAAPGPIPTDKAQQLEQLRMPCSPSKRLFQYQAGTPGSPLGGPCAPSPFITSPVGSLAADTASPLASPQRATRKIAKNPFRVLDAPALQDDFYLNLVDWSSQNVVAVGLGSCVYLWSANTSKVTKLCDLATTHDSVCSVAWSPRGSYLSVGCQSGKVQLWDVQKVQQVQTLDSHKARVGALAWGGGVLCSGSRDRSILATDLRVPGTGQVAKLAGHKSEVCGLKWSPDDKQLASGGNDNQLCVWAVGQSTSPVLRFTQHQAAVKALAWSPHQHGLLASGGGTADRCIRFWNTSSGAPISSLDTGSQVCNLCWSKNTNELVSTHGYSQHQVVVWRYPSMAKLTTLTGHGTRVLYLASSPDGQTIVTGAGDETLRFWNVFPGARAQGPSTGFASQSRSLLR